VTISAFDLFKIGIGPSSSHTVGPMRAAGMFVASLAADGEMDKVAGIRVELFGSLGATGHGHGSVKAVVLGLTGAKPETVDPAAAGPLADQVRETGRLRLPTDPAAAAGTATTAVREIAFDTGNDIVLHRRKRLPFHSNAMVFTAVDDQGSVLAERTYYSVGGGFVLGEDAAGAPAIVPDATPVPYPFRTGAELLAHTERSGLPISGVMMANELARGRDGAEIRDGLLRIWQVMQDCVRAGCAADGVLPGGLKVRRRARTLRETLERTGDKADPLYAMEWVTLYALAVNEQNAAGGRVVTAPTNGAAGIIPAVLHYYTAFVPGASDDGVVAFLLTAAAIGTLFKENASISGAEVGCQGEVGSACSMAAAGLAEVLGGTPRAGGERGRDRRRTQPRAHLRPGRRPGPDPLHRAERHCLGQGDHRGPDGGPGRRSAPRVAGQGDQDHAGDRGGHEGQVQGDRPRRPGRQRHRMLTGAAPGLQPSGWANGG
jgi:L-serine dehydratase